MATGSNPYTTLGVAPTASVDEIRRAFRKLARENHPDVRPNDAAALERFKQISAAHEILSDSGKRALYDEFGEGGLREGFDAHRARAYRGQPSSYGGRTAGTGTGAAGSEFFGGLGDMFGDLFGGGAGPAQTRRAAPMRASLQVSFAEAIHGGERRLEMPRMDICPACQGVPGRRDQCRRCFGDGVAEVSQALTVRIPKGTRPNTVLRVPGGRGAQGGGDLLLTISVAAHDFFRFEGDDLVLKLPLTIEEALLGASVAVPTPDGTVQLRIPACTQPGTRLRLRGKGGKARGRQTDLYAEVAVALPTRLGEAEQAAARTLGAAYEGSVRAALRL